MPRISNSRPQYIACVTARDIILLIGGIVVGLGGLSLSLWAMFRDRSRGRRRCPRCWHELIANQSPCPECGRAVENERETRRTKRRWRWAMAGVLLIGAGAITARWPWFESGGWIKALPTDVLIELVPHVKGDWALIELNERGRVWRQTSSAPDAAWSERRWARVVRACGGVIFDPTVAATTRNTALVTILRAPDITSLVPGLIAGLSNEDQNMRSSCLLVLKGRRFDLYEYKDVVLDTIRRMPEESRALAEEEIRSGIENFESLSPVGSTPASNETPSQAAEAIERGGVAELIRHYRAWNIHSTTFTWAYSTPPDAFCVERSIVDLGNDQPPTEVVHIRDTWGLHGEAIVMQQIQGRWRALPLIFVGNRVSPTVFLFEPLKTAHGTLLAVRTLNVAFPPNLIGPTSDSDCYAAFDLRSGFPRQVVYEMTSVWDDADTSGSGGRNADTSLATGKIQVVTCDGEEYIEFPMVWTWRLPPARGGKHGAGRVLFTHRYTIRHAWNSWSRKFEVDMDSSDMTATRSLEMVYGWPGDSLDAIPGEFRALARGEEWQRRWLVDYLKSCKPSKLRSELEAMLSDVVEKAGKGNE